VSGGNTFACVLLEDLVQVLDTVALAAEMVDSTIEFEWMCSEVDEVTLLSLVFANSLVASKHIKAVVVFKFEHAFVGL
jgi:hypothetical protein